MSSRITNPDSTSQSGVSFPGGSSSSSNTQKNLNITKDDSRTRLSKAATAFNGHPVEIWADGAVWDTTSGVYLYPGRDFNPGDVQRT